MKVTIVGAGNVGATCAEYIAQKRIASKVVLLEPFVFVIIRTPDICIFSRNSQTDNLFSSSSLFIITSFALLLSTTYYF